MHLIRDPRLLILGALVALLAQGRLDASEALERFGLVLDESRIITRVSGPFGGVVEGKLTLKEGEVAGDLRDLEETGSLRKAKNR